MAMSIPAISSFAAIARESLFATARDEVMGPVSLKQPQPQSAEIVHKPGAPGPGSIAGASGVVERPTVDAIDAVNPGTVRIPGSTMRRSYDSGRVAADSSRGEHGSHGRLPAK